MANFTMYPVYASLEECVAECGTMVSYCTGHMPHLVCQLNLYVFLFVIFIAIFTGVFVPLSCLFCWVNDGFRLSKTTSRIFSPCSIFSKKRKNRRRRNTGTDEEKSSLYPSSPPMLQPDNNQKCRQPSSFSLPAVTHEVIVEECEASYSSGTTLGGQKSKRCRKITFDLSMTQRANDFSQL